MVKRYLLSKATILIFSLAISYVQGFCPSKQLGRVNHSLSFRQKTTGVLQRPIDRPGRYPTYTINHSALQAVPLDLIASMYKDSLIENPLETKLITGGILAFFGDAIAQSREPEYDTKRAGAFVTFDIFYRAVQCAIFPYIVETCQGQYLSPLLSNVMDVQTAAILEQTCANQFIVIPFLYYPVFFTLTGYVQGLSADASIERAQNTLIPLLKRNWLFWLPVQYYQFGYVDEPLQIPFLCVAGLAWTFILSLAAGSVKNYGEESLELPEEKMISQAEEEPGKGLPASKPLTVKAEKVVKA